jgi:hypothetical protein
MKLDKEIRIPFFYLSTPDDNRKQNADINKSFDVEGIPVLHQTEKQKRKKQTNKRNIITSSKASFLWHTQSNPTNNDIDVSKRRYHSTTIYLQCNVSLPTPSIMMMFFLSLCSTGFVYREQTKQHITATARMKEFQKIFGLHLNLKNPCFFLSFLFFFIFCLF